MAPSTAVPTTFTHAVATLRSVRPRPEIHLAEITPPHRLAPFAYALSASVSPDGDEVANGRLVLLHDPAGHAAWQGTLRLVTYVTATIDVEMAADPLLPAVGWSWLTDSLEAQRAKYRAIAGAVTQTLSTRFGDIADSTATADIEIRASWTPVNTDLEAHLTGWCALLATTAGLPPPGIAVVPGAGTGPGGVR